VSDVKYLHISSLSMDKHTLSLNIVLDRTCIDDETARGKVRDVLDPSGASEMDAVSSFI
jgi:hypothetical protein